MNIKKLPVMLLLICFCLQQLPALSCDYVYKKPKSYNSSRENIAESDAFYDYNNRYTDILPNPIVYLYGKNTFDDPILLMTFSSTIPVEWLNGEKSSNLDSATLKLKISTSHGYFYKILKISADQILQTVATSTSSTLQSHVQGSGEFTGGGGGKGSLMGELTHTFNKSKAYDRMQPIITYSGVGSDTLTLMLKRGEEYPIPNGRINVYMLVRAIRDENNKIGKIINDHYNSKDDDKFYDNYSSFKNELDCLLCEISGCKYKDINTFFQENGMRITNPEGFQYKKINEFIETSVFFKYKSKSELRDALYDAELKDKKIKELIDKLTSNSNNPDSFLNRVSDMKKCECECKCKCKCKKGCKCKCKYECKGKDYVNVDYKIGQNIIDFINNVPLEKLVFENKNKVKVINNINASLNNTDSAKASDDSTSASDDSTASSDDSAKSSDDKKAADFKLSDYDLYAAAYELKMLVSAYNYAISNICCTSSEFDLTDYVKDDDCKQCKCNDKSGNCKYKTISTLNKNISIQPDPNNPVLDFELQKSALKVIDDMFNEKNKGIKNMDDILKVVSLDNLVRKASRGTICSWEALKNNPCYKRKYFNAITLVDAIYNESNKEKNNDETCNQDLIELVKKKNNVDLHFDKTIVQNKKNTFLNFERDRIDRWCPPLISRGVLLPVGALLWPLQLVDRRIEYHPSENAINTAKILEGSDFDDKEHQKEDGYIKDDEDYIFVDMKNQLDLIKKERDNTNIIPTIKQPQTGVK